MLMVHCRLCRDAYRQLARGKGPQRQQGTATRHDEDSSSQETWWPAYKRQHPCTASWRWYQVPHLGWHCSSPSKDWKLPVPLHSHSYGKGQNKADSLPKTGKKHQLLEQLVFLNLCSTWRKWNCLWKTRKDAAKKRADEGSTRQPAKPLSTKSHWTKTQ